jgi:peptidoglycan DL-endopeptidase CwlO
MRALPRLRRRLGVFTIVASIVVATGAVPGPAAGDEIDDVRAEAQRITARISELNAEIERLAEAHNAAQIELGAVQADIADAQAEVDAARAQVAVHEGELRSYAVQVYVDGGESTSLPMLLTSEGSDLTQRQGYLRATTLNRQDLIDALHTSEQELQVRLGVLDEKRAEAEALSADLEARATAADAAVAEHSSLLNQTNAELAQLIEEEQERQRAAAAAAAAERQRQADAAAQARQAQPAPPDDGGAPPEDGGGDEPAPPPPAPPPIGSGADAAVATAYAQLGDPYEWGAAGPDSFDCSGLTLYSWLAGGVSLPHNSAMQYAVTVHIDMSQIQPGDLVFYGWSSIDHVAIYVGGGQIIHAPHEGDVVRLDSVYYWDDLRGVGRVG